MIGALPGSLIAAIPVAIAAGIVSFASPCVLPLVPGYIAFMSGAIGHEDVKSRRGRALSGAIAFVLGFACIFVLEGALFGEFGTHLRAHQRQIQIGVGILTILMGMFFAGWLPNRWLQREARWHHVPSATVMGALVLGFFFGIGWTPCIGPTLEAIQGFALSSSGTSALRGSILSLFYCVGLGVPFLAFALLGERAVVTSRWLRRHQHAIAVIGGVMLIAIGVAELTGWWQSFVTWLQVNLPSPKSPL